MASWNCFKSNSKDSCAEGSRAGYSTLGKISLGQSKDRIPSFDLLPTLLRVQPRTLLASGLQAHNASSCLAFHPPTPPSPLCRATLYCFTAQHVLIQGIAPTQMWNLACGFVESHEVHMCPLDKLVQVPLAGILAHRPVSCTSQLSVIGRFAEDASILLCHLWR